jgi:hypothetical protein
MTGSTLVSDSNRPRRKLAAGGNGEQTSVAAMPGHTGQITGIIGPERLQVILVGLRKLKRVTNDKGEKVFFDEL